MRNTYMNQFRIIIFVLGDAIAFVLALLAMLFIKEGGEVVHTEFFFYLRAFAIPYILTLGIFYITDLYDIRRGVPTPRSIGRFLAAYFLSAIAIALYFYVAGIGIAPKTNLAIFMTLFSLLTIAWHRLHYYLFAYSFSRKTIVIGDNPEIERLKESLREHPQIGRIIAHLPSLEAYVKEQKNVDLIIMGRDVGVRDIELAAQITAPLMTLRDAFEEFSGRTPLSLISKEEIFSLLEKHRTKSIEFLYRIFEIAIAVFTLILALPFLILAALAIICEDGTPIIYQQTRLGRYGKPFTLYKLRTMYRNAEAEGAQWTAVKDTRVLKVGRVLRKLHLDEVPQMWNIIEGNLALVGPRPERPEFIEKLKVEVPYYFARERVKPGFTGWAQIKYHYARTIEDSKEKFEYDLYYLAHRSVLLDLGIFIKTLQIIFTH